MIIEVEQRFHTTKRELDRLLKDSNFLGEKTNHDVYYDFPDYRLAKTRIKLRIRNGACELKISLGSGASEEITNEEEIKKYLKTDLNLKDFIDKNLKVFMEYETIRKEYQKGGFTITVDKCKFDKFIYELVEIEKITEDKDKIKEIKNQINIFAMKNGLDFTEVDSKKDAYLKSEKPEVYDEIHEKKVQEIKTEIKMK